MLLRTMRNSGNGLLNFFFQFYSGLPELKKTSNKKFRVSKAERPFIILKNLLQTRLAVQLVLD